MINKLPKQYNVGHRESVTNRTISLVTTHKNWTIGIWSICWMSIFFDELKNIIPTNKQEAAQQQKKKLPPFKILDKRGANYKNQKSQQAWS